MSQVHIRDYERISGKLKILFKLDKSPVAVKLYKSENDVKKILPKFEDKAKHCQLTYISAQNKKSFYATVNEVDCKSGAGSLGLLDVPNLKVPKAEPINEAVAYAPLENATFEPDVVILYCNVMQAFDFITLYRRSTGKRLQPDLAGTQALCSESVIIPKETKKPNISFGCPGSRAFSDLKEDELIISLTVDDAEIISNFA
ncbi:DUF169 domain-containing protein [Methanosphaera sp. WGK6]|uniref:DUF169 domain-containing protein n=1 Tax=Methanosphaera sp. WGK6 TaxID=1561964 RepID=UPI00084C29E0|nr:DUF169 domain-containing protein [Methanosphaera sp. WGK6]OED30645.1 hypothetical protein NL43_01510 [Methanosphaera sp. WGK6]